MFRLNLISTKRRNRRRWKRKRKKKKKKKKKIPYHPSHRHRDVMLSQSTFPWRAELLLRWRKSVLHWRSPREGGHLWLRWALGGLRGLHCRRWKWTSFSCSHGPSGSASVHHNPNCSLSERMRMRIRSWSGMQGCEHKAWRGWGGAHTDGWQIGWYYVVVFSYFFKWQKVAEFATDVELREGCRANEREVRFKMFPVPNPGQMRLSERLEGYLGSQGEDIFEALGCAH